MTTETRRIVVNGLPVQIVRKDIKNLHLGVYPPHGRVRVAAPLRVSDNAVRLAVISKLGWIKRQQARFDAQPRQSEREMVSGESHYFLGRRYRLRFVRFEGAAKVIVRSPGTIELHARAGLTADQREKILLSWYRERLKKIIPALVEKWQNIVGVRAEQWAIRKMKTKWGACNAEAGRIWLNLELVKKPVQCLEYIIVHELVHLLERRHNERFNALMSELMPQWRTRRADLNAAPLAHETWSY
jgi:predicted metal-dependent hydrolase